LTSGLSLYLCGARSVASEVITCEGIRRDKQETGRKVKDRALHWHATVLLRARQQTCDLWSYPVKGQKTRSRSKCCNDLCAPG